MNKLFFAACLFTMTLLTVTSCTSRAKKSDEIMNGAEQETAAVNYVAADTDTLAFTIDVPDYMTPSNQIGAAPFQYLHLVKEQYLFATYENLAGAKTGLSVINPGSKLPFLESYADYFNKNFGTKAKITSEVMSRKVKIGGLPAIMVKFDAKAPSVPVEVTYFVTYIEGKENIYSIVAWTLKTYKGTFTPIVEKIVGSFRVKD